MCILQGQGDLCRIVSNDRRNPDLVFVFFVIGESGHSHSCEMFLMRIAVEANPSCSFDRIMHFLFISSFFCWAGLVWLHEIKIKVIVVVEEFGITFCYFILLINLLGVRVGMNHCFQLVSY